MIFVNHFGNSKAAKDYHGHLSQGDAREYHGAGFEHLPTWQGKTAGLLGIEHQPVTKDGFFSLCDNKHPLSGDRLTLRTKSERRAMTDLTFDVPKSVSLAGVVDPRIDRAVDEAVDETMRMVEQEMCVRVRKGGQDTDRLTGNALWTVWKHETSRPLNDGTVDPQKHRHVTVMNVSFDKEEGVYKACQFGNIVRDKGWFQSAYHGILSRKLADLGYGIEKDGTSFKLTGISRELCDKFSRRHDAIDKAAEETGIVDAKGRAKLAKTTRNRKGNELGSDKLNAEWLGRMTPGERASLHAAKNQGGTSGITADEAVQYAMDHSFYHHSTISEKRLKATALQYGVGSVLPDEIDRAFAKREDVIRKNIGGEVVVTTQSVLRDEMAMLKWAREGHGTVAPIGGVEHLPDHLSAEQGAAAANILQSRDAIVGLSGGAGTGKTETLKALKKAIEGSGRQVYGFAPSATASRGELRQAGFHDAETLESLFKNDRTQNRVRGHVLLVDEAGQMSTGDMMRLAAVAKQQNCRVILSGDYRQHGSVRAGDAMRLLEQEAGVKFSRLKTIRRQTNEQYRQAVEMISKGDAVGAVRGFKALDKMGCIVQASGEERHKLLVKDYLQAVTDKRSALVIAPTHAEGERLTNSLRKALKERGELGKERPFVVRHGTNWTDAQKGDSRNYEPGMIIEVFQNCKGGWRRGECAVVVAPGSVLRRNGEVVPLPKETERFQVYRTGKLDVAEGERIRITQNGRVGNKRISNGDIYTVEGFTKDGAISCDGGRVVLPNTYGHFTRGYVDTSYASQGKTVDRVFVATGNESLGAANQQQWYVSVSRGREACKVYVDSKKDVREAIARTGQRMAAVELVKPDVNQRVKETLERNRILEYMGKGRDAATWRERVRERSAYGR